MIPLKERRSGEIVVTGGSGFLGSHVVEQLRRVGVPSESISVPRSTEFDLRNAEMARRAAEGARVVIHLAANVGGIGKNRELPGTLYYDNLMMGTNMVEQSRLTGVEKFVAIGTVCAYPKFTPVPFKEVDLWNGYPEETNAPYGLAKKMLLVQLQAYRQQYGFHGIYLLPVNLYGPKDNFGDGAHVIPDIIKKVHRARVQNLPSIELFGDGTPTREFLHVRDAARGIVLAAERYESPEPVNLGSSMEISIRELAEKITRIMRYPGTIAWDTDKPNGQPRRKLDVTKAAKFGFKSEIDFDTGLAETIEWYEREIAPKTI